MNAGLLAQHSGAPYSGAPYQEQGTVARAPAATLYLALFLMLLAFFLFLTSISTFDPARSVSVLDSVEARFADGVAAQAGPERVSPPFAGPAGEAIVADAGFVSQVARALAPLENGADEAVGRDGVPWHGVRLSQDVLFVDATAAVSAQARQVIEAAAVALVDAGEQSTNRRVDIVVGGSDDLARRRAAVLAALVAGIAGPEAVSLRSAPQHSAVELVFYAVTPARSGS